MSVTNYAQGKPATGKKYLLATPVYDSPASCYTFSLHDTCIALTEAGVNFGYLLLSGNCHVDDARNEVVKTFLASDCTDLVFLDADVSWRGEQLVRLLSHKEPMVGGVYAYRKENDQLPVRLGKEPMRKDGLIEVEGLPTGFLKINRSVFEAMDCPSYQNTTIYFERTLIDGTRWGGDLNFCNRWRALGGKVYADADLRLGHSGKATYVDSLGAFLRRQDGSTLRHVARKVKAGTETADDVQEAIALIDNPFGVNVETALTAIKCARQAKGPIIESGSGLTTVLMAAATKETVFCLESSEFYADRLREMSRLAGVTNIGLCVCPIKNGWYDLTGKTLPDSFALGLNDGPTRKLGHRMPFFDHFDPDVVVCDDVDDLFFRAKLETLGRRIDIIEPRTAILRK